MSSCKELLPLTSDLFFMLLFISRYTHNFLFLYIVCVCYDFPWICRIKHKTGKMWLWGRMTKNWFILSFIFYVRWKKYTNVFLLRVWNENIEKILYLYVHWNKPDINIDFPFVYILRNREKKSGKLEAHKLLLFVGFHT